MCIALSGQDGVVEQARRQLEDLVRLPYLAFRLHPPSFLKHFSAQVPVWAVLDYTNTRTIMRELLLVKVSILGPEYVEDQLQGGPSHEPRRGSDAIPPPPSGGESHHTKLEREMALAHRLELGTHPEHAHDPALGAVHHPPPLTPSEALRLKHQHLQSISVLAAQFGAKIVDVSNNSVIVELTAKTTRVEAFLSLVKPFGVLESARTG
jgi:acetolactate synthase I/III small subunit